MTTRYSRRAVLKRGAAAVAAAAGFPYLIPGSALGLNGAVAPSNRITVATIGTGPQGCGVMNVFLGQPEARVIAVCDVNDLRRAEAKKLVDKHYGDHGCASCRDFRELLARTDLDAVHIAAPDHWHVPISLAAARAGKDMYTEKPLGLSVAANLALRKAIRAHGNVFQFGTQHRSERNFRYGCELVRNGAVGRLHTIRVGSLPSIESENLAPEPVPDWIDYELWLGPAPWAPFNQKRIIDQYWWHNYDYSLGFVAGYGVHYVDIAQWGNDTERSGPIEIEGRGTFPKDGMRDCAIAWDVQMTYANGVRLIYTDTQKTAEGITFEGDEGKVYVTLGRTESDPPSLVQRNLGPRDLRLYESDNHVRNFLDCVKSRAETICPIDVAVRSDTLCHLSDIAMRLPRKLRWDPEREQFLDDADANRMLSARPMREPWTIA